MRRHPPVVFLCDARRTRRSGGQTLTRIAEPGNLRSSLTKKRRATSPGRSAARHGTTVLKDSRASVLSLYLDQRPHPRVNAALEVVIAFGQAAHFGLAAGCDVN